MPDDDLQRIYITALIASQGFCSKAIVELSTLVSQPQTLIGES
jgi:hypothetical protein